MDLEKIAVYQNVLGKLLRFDDKYWRLKMNILSFEFSLDHGFAWIVVDGKKEGDKYTVQCCLVEKDGKFIPQIESSDCGHNWGLCSDSNEKAFEYWGENRCMNALFNKAKLSGIEVI